METKDFLKIVPNYAVQMIKFDAIQRASKGRKAKYAGLVLEKRKKRKDPMKKPTEVTFEYNFKKFMKK